MTDKITTVADLIERLKQHPADMPVVVSGLDEFGFEHIVTVQPVSIQKYDQQWMHAPDYIEAGEPDATGDVITALHID